MTLRTQRSFQALVLLALGLYVLNKIGTGTLTWYINQRFLPLSVFAGVLCLVLAYHLVRQRSAVETDHVHDHEAHADHPHATLSAWALVVVALPVILGVLVPARPLGASAIANRGLNTSAPLANDAPIDHTADPSQRTVLEWVRAFNYESDPSVFDGQPADVVGFIYRDARLPAGQFLVSRFAVSCCIADAMALGMIVEGVPVEQWGDNTWVRVRGSVQAAVFNHQAIPLIHAETVEAVVPPDNPYLYP